MRPVHTIGYEARTLPEVIAALSAAGVELVVDVRAVAASRRPGFSKTVLAASLEEAGIAYLHLRALGTPKAGRVAARAGRCEEMRAIFTDHLREPSATAAFERLSEEVSARRACLLCYEADPTCCRREVLTQRLRPGSTGDVRHLTVAAAAAEGRPSAILLEIIRGNAHDFNEGGREPICVCEHTRRPPCAYSSQEPPASSGQGSCPNSSPPAMRCWG